MCTHAYGHRFDPGLCAGTCPVCGSINGAKTGDPTPGHQPAGSREMCPGSGQPAQ
ncbi:hypothetical protein GCM10023082_26450 [Streptomyces tremellae]|uniref:Uncharacterized protein n=1 Tax=Streptomyces tremellae TaxID=1124239 RepID=A0ABP7EXK2_9ACTN